VAVSGYSVFFLIQLVTFTIQNKLLSHRRVNAEVRLEGQCIQVDLISYGPLEVAPGQFLSLYIPSLGFVSKFQTRSFMVSWQAKNITTVLVEPKRNFSRRLKLLVGSKKACHAWIAGPYGNPPGYGTFEAIIFVANGIGIAAHIFAMKDLLAKYRQRQVMTRSIHIYWWMDDKSVWFDY
jgi:NAD(P)H-flavin reductase